MKLKSAFLTLLLSIFLLSNMALSQSLEESFTEAEVLYNNSEKSLSDQSRFFQVLRELAASGHACAKYRIASFYVSGNVTSQDYSLAFSEANRAYELGCERASARLAYYYKRGIGTDIDLNRSLEMYIESADGGSSTSAYRVAEIYRAGNESIERNLIQAYEWLVKASRMGSASAMEELDSCKFNGFFCESHLAVIP